MTNKNELVQCFNDTRKMAVNDMRLSAITDRAKNNTKMYYEGFQSNRRGNDKNAEIIVEEGTTFVAAKKYSFYGHIAVLNFANPENPGGGVQNGAMAQEECLCRSSNLFECISCSDVFEDYYNYHRKLGNSFYSDRIIYSKDVTVFKTDDTVPTLMPQSDWFQVDVITCAAPYLAKRKYTNKKSLLELFKSRIKNIFETAIDNQVDVLILGAFGCGAFKNPPEIVAKAFHEVILRGNYQSVFKSIVFAIKRTSGVQNNLCPNLVAFCRTFGCEHVFVDDYSSTRVLSEEPGKLCVKCGCDEYGDFAIQYKHTDYLLGKAVTQECSDKYIKWQKNNRYFGKQFSILGDSISTLEGFNPRGYNVFFKGENCDRAGVYDMSDTWWGKVIDFFGGELLVNNSWSGSRVTRLPDRDEDFPSGISEKRTNGLHINSVKPDVIIVYLGTNDWAYGVTTGYADHLLDNQSPECYSFEDSYDTMLRKIRINYPEAQIICCTLNTTFMSSKPSFSFPYSHGGTHIEKYNDVIRNASSRNKCRLIDLYHYHLPYDAVDGSHPTSEGMNTLATMMIRGIDADAGSQFLDCTDNNHDFIVADEFTGGTLYTCKKCGKTKCTNTLLSGQDKAEENNDIIDLNPNCTSLLYSEDEGIHLTWEKDGKEVVIHDKTFTVGRDSDCTLNIDNKFVARQQAVFQFENGNWTICDNGSTNGTWLNETKLIPGKKYVLHPDDSIDLAHSEKLFFFKTRQQEQNSDAEASKALSILEAGIKVFAESNNSDEISFKLIISALVKAPMYIPVTMDVGAMLGGLDPTKLKKGDVITSNENVGMTFQRIKVSDMELIPIFTSNEELRKGPATSALNMHPSDYFPMIAKTNTDVVINPFGGKAFHLKQEAIKELLLPLISKNNLQTNSMEHKPESDLLSGKSIGDGYVLDTVIGHGGATTVYLSHDRTGKKYAVKVINKTSVSNKGILDSICGEAQLLNKLDHPYIRKVKDICQDELYVFLVFEYIDGMNLEQVMQGNNGKPLPYEQVINYSKQIASALQYIHSQTPPIINRDVKPRNIVIDKFGNVKMVDFDIAMQYDPSKSDDVCLGTMGYAAPEQFKGKSIPQSDIYALGVTMHYLVTGIDPKGHTGEVKPIRQVNSMLPKGLEYIINKCVAVNIDDRYKNADELLSDLDNCRKFPKKKGLFGWL